MHHLYSERNLGPWDWDPYWPEDIRKWPPNELEIMIQIDTWIQERTAEEIDKLHKKQPQQPAVPHG